MRCPIDGTTLKHIEYEGCVINACESCGGELLSGEALAHIVKAREERFGPEFCELVAECTPTHGEVTVERDRALVCPCCDSGMQPINYAGDTAIFIDRCGSCGAIWLDEHELEMIQTLMEKWADAAPEQFRSIAKQLDDARRTAQQMAEDDAPASRFAFVNAIFGRFLDAA